MGLKLFPEMEYGFWITNYKKEGYNETEAQIKALKYLSKKYNFIVKEVAE